MILILVVTTALLLDKLLGETRFYHPLVGFGSLANLAEKFLYRDNLIILRGVVAAILLIAPILGLVWWIESYLSEYSQVIWEVIILYFAIGWQSLNEHAELAQNALDQGDLSGARLKTGYLVSRDCSELQPPELSGAVVESVLENGSDALFASLFWFLLAGVYGVILHRLVNTLDAMWGYKSQRYLYFGRFAAKLDDLLNWVPARLTALSYLIVGNSSMAWQCWSGQAKLWKSSNAGAVMAAGAGALQLSLGGAATYHGEVQKRPELGCGNHADIKDIGRALNLLQYSVLLWVVVLVFVIMVSRSQFF